MRIIIEGKAQEVADSYAARLIEQGKAVPAPPEPARPAEAQSAPPPETPKEGRNKGKRKDVTGNEPKNKG